MPDVENLREMARRVRDDWIDAGVAVSMARERHDNLHRELFRLETEITRAEQARSSSAKGDES